MERWLFHDNVTISIRKFPGADIRPVPHIWYNGWRPGDRCLDLHWRIGWVIFNITLWNMPGGKYRRWYDD